MSSSSVDPPLNAFSYISLITFLVTVVFVISPFNVPIPFLRKRYIPINLATAPLLAIVFLLATTSINLNVVLSGLVGIPSLQPYSILILFFSIAYICISLDQTGFLRFAALWALRRAKTNGRHIFVAFFLLTTVASGLTSNDAVILTATPFLIHFADSAKIDPPSAFLMSEFVTANIASMLLYIGNPTNVVVAQANYVTFAEYSAWMVLPTIVCTALAFLVLRYVLFSSEKYIPRQINVDSDAISPRDALTDPYGAIFGGALLTACLIVLMVTSIFGTPVWEVTLPFACASLARDIWFDITNWNKQVTVKKPVPVPVLKVTQALDEESEHPDEKLEEIKNLEENEKVPDIPLSSSYSSTLRTLVPQQLAGSTSVDMTSMDPTPVDPTSVDQTPVDQTPADQTPADQIPADLTPAGSTVADFMESTGDSTQADPTLAQSKPDQTRFARYILIFAHHFPKVYDAFLRLPWTILPFALGMFILVESLTATGWTAVLAKGLGYLAPSFVASIFSMGVISLLLCSFLNNIPATILLTRVLLHPSYSAAVSGYVGPPGSPQYNAIMTGALYGLVAGSNLGACLTIAASLAGIMWQQLLKSAGIKAIGPWRFFLWNLLIAPVLIVGACLVLCAEVYVIFLR